MTTINNNKNLRLVTPNLIVPDPVTLNKSRRPHPNGQYKSNKIHTSKYTWLTFLPKNLFEQFYRFANMYFLFIQILNWLPGMEVFVKEIQLMPLLFVLSVTAIKDLFEDRRRHLSDKRVNNFICRRYEKKSKRFVRTKWKDIVVGDLVHLSCNEMVPADILLLKSKSAEDDDYGVCYVETSNLDGENNLKPRYVVQDFAKPNQEIDNINFNFVVECEKPNMKLHKFQGTILYGNSQRKVPINKDNLLLRGCKLKNTSYAEGLVIYAGHETKAMLNNKGPRHKRSRLEKMMNRDIVMCVVILIIMCYFGFMGQYLWFDQFANLKQPILYIDYENPIESLNFTWPLQSFLTFLILYQMIIPISLYVCIEMVKLGQVYIINRDEKLLDCNTNKRCECRAWNITEDLGQIEYIFCDKTGTLTENIMQFQCCSINGVNYGHELITISSSQMHNQKSLERIKTNPELEKQISKLKPIYDKWSKDPLKFNFDHEQQMIHDFFIVLTICNTARTSQGTHEDILNAKGQPVFPPSATTSVGQSGSSKKPRSYSFDFFNVFQPSKKQLDKSNQNKKKRKQSEIDQHPCFESESPDEVALVMAAYQYDYRLKKRGRDLVNVQLPNGSNACYKVIHVLQFDSNRKRMSIIVQCPFTRKMILYVKGSDQTVLEKLSRSYENDQKKKNELKLVKNHLDIYSRKGLRVLCIAKRILTQKELKTFLVSLERAECHEKREEHLLKLFNSIESNLELLGATAIEDKLQNRVPEVIKSLRQAGIMVWVLTGDKMETAISIAKSCSLFNSDLKLLMINLTNVRSKKTAKQELMKNLDIVRQQNEDETAEARLIDDKSDRTYSSKKSKCLQWMKKIYEFLNRENQQHENVDHKQRDGHQYGLVIDGPSLNFVLQKENIHYFIALTQYCGSVLCCRVTPSQKSNVVKYVKSKLNVLTMAVGDGANDVSMIQTAHVGVGVLGLEGAQAAMASDFAIPKFHYLERLILVHGNLCYNRLALTILYFFYKNTLVVFVIFFYQFLCGFSGTSMLDDLYLMAVNIFYTTLPAIVRGILEKDCDEQVFLDHPKLYDRGRKSTVYTYRSFWVNTCDSIYQSSIIFFICYSIFADTSIGVHEFGLIIFIMIIVTNLLQICMEIKFWNPYFVLSIIISIGLFLSSALFLDFNYSIALLSILGGRNYKIFMNIVFRIEFLRTLILVPVICLLPRFTIRAMQNILKPQFIIPSNIINNN